MIEPGRHAREHFPDRRTIQGALPRGRVTAKSAVDTRDNATQENVEGGEDLARAEDNKALKANLPRAVRRVVYARYQHILRHPDRIRDMPD